MSARGTRKGARWARATPNRKKLPVTIQIARNDQGSTSMTATRMAGQLRPHTKASTIIKNGPSQRSLPPEGGVGENGAGEDTGASFTTLPRPDASAKRTGQDSASPLGGDKCLISRLIHQLFGFSRIRDPNFKKPACARWVTIHEFWRFIQLAIDL